MANPTKIPATVTTIKSFGDGIYSVAIKPEKKRPNFKPGQFLHLAIDEYDPQGGFWPESRVFSIASRPSDNEISIAYSIKGKFTKKMENELTEGKNVWLKLPYGDFIVDSIAGTGKDIILIAGGTGITPYLSFLHHEALSRSKRKITLFYGVRKIKHIICEDLLELCGTNIEHFSLKLFVEEDASPMPKRQFPFEKGILKSESIIDESTKLSSPVFFLSGPPLMIRIFKKSFIDKGIESNRIAVDEWE